MTFAIDSTIGATFVTGAVAQLPDAMLAKCIARLESLGESGFDTGADILVEFKAEASRRAPAAPLIAVLSNEIEEESAPVEKPAASLDNSRFANLCLHSDVEPYQIVKVVSDKTIEIRRMSAALDPTWKPEIQAGGFAGHCSNQRSQRWIYAVDESAPIVRARLRKDGDFYSAYGRHILADKPRKFHDYNF